MHTRRGIFPGRGTVGTSWLRWVAPAGLATAFAAATVLFAPTASAETDYGNGCVLVPNDPAATVAALRDRCSDVAQDQIFRDAPRGTVPTGTTNGVVTRPPVMRAVAPPFWIGKNFYTGPDGGRLMNRITAAGVEGFPANVYTAPSVFDGQPVWALDYAPSITPQILDEVRQITPGVWFGYSWWRGAFQTPLLLTFALTN